MDDCVGLCLSMLKMPRLEHLFVVRIKPTGVGTTIHGMQEKFKPSNNERQLERNYFLIYYNKSIGLQINTIQINSLKKGELAPYIRFRIENNCCR